MSIAPMASVAFEESEEVQSSIDLLGWNAWDVAGFLSDIGLAQHIEAFSDAQIDGESLSVLDTEMLVDLGVTSVGQRIRLLRAVYDVKLQWVSDMVHRLKLCDVADDGFQAGLSHR